MATVGDIGEWIAAKVFDIELAATANNTAFDGHFTTGSLAGQTVNVKTYLQQYGSLDVTESPALDYPRPQLRRPRNRCCPLQLRDLPAGWRAHQLWIPAELPSTARFSKTCL
jgi:hypothetical protein